MPDFSVPSWLIPPTQAQQAELNQRESVAVANQILQQQQLNQQAAQQKAIEAHRKIQEGIEQSQEARQQALFAKTASNELSRRIGMKMINDHMEIYMADHPDATPAEKAQATTEAVLKNADKVFPDGQGFAPFLQHTQDMLGKVGLNQALIDARESTVRKNDVVVEKMKTETWLGPGNAGAAKPTAASQNAKLFGDAQTAYDSAVESGDDAIIKSAKTHLDSVKAAMHVVAPEDEKLVFDKLPNGQGVAMRGKRTYFFHDPAQEARIKAAGKGLEDVNQRIRDLEASTRLKPEEKTKRLAPLLKQRDDLDAQLKPMEAVAAMPVPIESPSTTPSRSSLLNAAPTTPAPAPVAESIPPRPPGLTDEDLLRQAREAVKQKSKDPAWLKQRLKDWGVKGEL